MGVEATASSRLPGIGPAFRTLLGLSRRKFSFTELFSACGMKEYRRKNVRIRSRVPTSDEARRLAIPAVQPVQVTIVTSTGQGDVPLTYAETCFSSSRVELTIDF